MKECVKKSCGLGDSDSELSSIAFMTLDQFIEHLEKVITPDEHNQTPNEFKASRKVGYRYFESHIYPRLKNSRMMDSLVLWTQIRSFIKGSVEVARNNRHLTLEEYLDLSVFSSERCRLDSEDRCIAFKLYTGDPNSTKTRRNLMHPKPVA